jgi:hypothetical protein
LVGPRPLVQVRRCRQVIEATVPEQRALDYAREQSYFGEYTAHHIAESNNMDNGVGEFLGIKASAKA